MKYKIFIFSISTIMICGLYYIIIYNNNVYNNIDKQNTNHSNFTTTQEYNDQGTSTKNNSNRYINNYFNYSFYIPTGWYIDKDYLSEDQKKLGFVQAYNYNIDTENKSFAKGQNKISFNIGDKIYDKNYFTSDTLIPDKVETSQSIIYGIPYTVYKVYVDNKLTIINYNTKLINDKYLYIMYYGDTDNVESLNEILKSVYIR